MDEMYKRTRWAAPGGGGYSFAGWVAILAGLWAAVYTFRRLITSGYPWWVAVLAAILAWLAGTAVVGVLWAVVRRLLEHSEGI